MKVLSGPRPCVSCSVSTVQRASPTSRQACCVPPAPGSTAEPWAGRWAARDRARWLGQHIPNPDCHSSSKSRHSTFVKFAFCLILYANPRHVKVKHMGEKASSSVKESKQIPAHWATLVMKCNEEDACCWTCGVAESFLLP